MNFEEWFKEYTGADYDGETYLVKESWNACKEEILKILRENNVQIPDTNTRPVFNNDGSWYFGNIDIFKEIENL